MTSVNPKKVLLVFGTRPEAIKMAPLVKEFQKHPSVFETIVCVTGQHRQLLDPVLKLFEIAPDFDLSIMKKGQDLFDVTSRVLMGMREVLSKINPDVVLVHGDTTTSTGAALAAFYHQIPVGHVEAWLRTNNIYSPWPEEANRQITGRLARWHFAPTEMARKNLILEGIPQERISVTGNTVIDSLNLVMDKIRNSSKIEGDLQDLFSGIGIPVEVLAKWKSGQRKMVLITGHRRENFGTGFRNICNSIRELSEFHMDVDFVYPVHLNPNVRESVYSILGQPIKKGFLKAKPQLNGFCKLKNVYLIEPLNYLSFVYLMNQSYLVLTDSGGLQEEAPSLGKPVLVMRDTTERPEALAAGTVELVGTDPIKIIDRVEYLLFNESSYRQMSRAINPFGDGEASSRIVKELGNGHPNFFNAKVSVKAEKLRNE